MGILLVEDKGRLTTLKSSLGKDFSPSNSLPAPAPSRQRLHSLHKALTDRLAGWSAGDSHASLRTTQVPSAKAIKYSFSRNGLSAMDFCFRMEISVLLSIYSD